MDLTYDEVGATLDGSLPPGYSHLRERTMIGRGAEVERAAAAAVLDWRMHRALGVGIDTTAPAASPGVDLMVRLGIGPLALLAPCRVVWADSGGFGYGTLRGHPESGEEAFLVSRDSGDQVWLTVTAFSRPAVWFTRAAGPLVPAMQRLYARRLGTVLRRLVTPSGGTLEDQA